MQPTLFFPFIHTYGLMLAIGFYAGWYIAARRAKAHGVDPDVIGNLVLVSILAGVAGARVLHFALYKPPGEPLWAIFKVWEGGLVFYGGLIGALIANLAYLKWKRLDAWLVADLMAPAIAIGQAFGRIGCFLNGCCFGGPASPRFPLAVRFPRLLDPAGLPSGSPAFLDHVKQRWITDAATHSLPVHPAQLYDSIGLFVIAALLVVATPHRRRNGELLGLLFVLHGFLRLAVEFVRTDTLPVALGLKAGQLGALVALAIGAATLAWVRRHSTPADTAR
ncbi:MAG: prolipoprotein diacylglyceryl transferase [Candidatus Brocadiae bacterium]|nr:prolipoprotein diacylglyceryl transferase [Candidatus Brocadiia bacterium]